MNVHEICIFFFKYSYSRWEDYKNMQEITDIVTWYVLKHCPTDGGALS